MLTPAQRHFQRVMAERHGKTDGAVGYRADSARANHAPAAHGSECIKASAAV